VKAKILASCAVFGTLLAASPAAGGTLDGMLVTEEGKPVEGAWVGWRENDGALWTHAESDSFGAFSLDCGKACGGIFYAEAEDFIPVEIRAGSSGSLEIPPVLILAPDTALRGKILAKGGNPAMGAEVRLLRSASEHGFRLRWEEAEKKARQRAVSSPAGTFRFKVPPSGIYEIAFRAPGHPAYCRSGLEIGGKKLQKNLLLEIPEESPMRGHVFRLEECGEGKAPKKIPLEGVFLAPMFREEQKVDAGKEDAPIRPMWETVFCRSGAEGFFELWLPPIKSLTLAAMLEGYAPSLARDIRPGAAVEMTLGRGGVVLGKVEDEHGAPIEGAFVEYTFDGPNFCHEKTFRAESRAKGAFTLALMPEGGWELKAGRRGYASARQRISLKNLERREGLVFTLEKAPSIEGTVRDEAGKPVKGAKVRAWVEIWQPLDEAETGEDGRYRLEGLKAEKIKVAVEAEGYAEARKPGVEPGKNPVLDFTLHSPGSLRGRVRDAATGLPVERFSITFMREIKEEESRHFGPGHDFFSPDGRFELEDLSPGAYALTASSAGHAPSELKDIELAAGQNVEGLEIELGKGRSVRGRVLREDTRQPIEDAKVHADTVGFSSGWPHRVFTDSEGRFTLAALAPGVVTLNAEHENYADGEVQAEIPPEGEPAEVEILLEAGGRVRVRIVDAEGKPFEREVLLIIHNLSEGGMAFSGNQFHKEEPGVYLSSEVHPPGSYEVYVFGDISVRREAAVLPLQIAEVPITLRRAVLTGKVTHRGGPMPNVRVDARQSSMSSSFSYTGESGEVFSSVRSAAADVRGVYRIEGLQPGEYGISIDDVFRGKAVMPEAGPEEIPYDIAVPGGEIRGRVVEKGSGAPVAGAEPSCRRAGEEDFFSVWRDAPKSAADGSFTLSYLEAGRYIVSAMLGDVAYSASSEVEVPENGTVEGVLVEVGGGAGSAEGFVRTRQGTPVQAYLRCRKREERSASAWAWSNHADGAYRFENLDPGPYVLTVEASGFAWRETEVEVSAEEPAHADFALLPEARINLIVREMAGEPVPGAEVSLWKTGGNKIESSLWGPAWRTNASYATNSRGEYPLRGLPPGSYTVKAELGGRGTEGSLTLQEGETKELTLILP
jgi:protocatechuate 3,4-dioxygenase beta subunit